MQSIEQRRAAVSEALQAGSLTSADVADLASRFGCSHRTIRGDALRLRRCGTSPGLQLLSGSTTGSVPDWRTISAEDARVWMLEQLAAVASDRSAGSAAGVGAVRAMVPVFDALQAQRRTAETDTPARTPDELLGELQAVATRLPRSIRRELRAALEAG